jgi:hypothetical protein
MRHALAAVEAAIFLSRPIALVLPRLKICLGVLRAPSRLEIGARLVERGRGAALMFSGMGSRINPQLQAHGAMEVFRNLTVRATGKS